MSHRLKGKPKRPKDLTMTDEMKFEIAQEIVRKSNVLRAQSSSFRRAWCEGFVNGMDYVNSLKVKKITKRSKIKFWLKGVFNA